MADPVATAVATAELRRIFVGATVSGMQFGVPQLDFVTAEAPGEPYVQPFSGWTLYPQRPASFADGPTEEAQDDLLMAVALRHKVVEDVEVLSPWPHLLLTFGDGAVLCIGGREPGREAWTAGLNCPAPANRVQVTAGPGGKLGFRRAGVEDDAAA
jgi:hypothetical protein